MYFCPKCSYSFDITKTTNNSSDNRKPLSLFNAFKHIDDISLYKALFSKKELYNNKKYKKLNNKEKQKMEQLFDKQIISKAMFQCSNCYFSENISETIKLYQLDLTNKIDDNILVDNYELLIHDPTLPRTKDYTCKNIECPSHKDNNNKEAVYIKQNNSYKITYICTICNLLWHM